MKKLPAKYSYLSATSSPNILVHALAEYGTREVKGHGNNPKILGWAKEVDPRANDWLGNWYKSDSIPWCGLFVGVCAARAGFPHGQSQLAALNWLKWGMAADKPSLGDVMIFKRKGGGHVGFYVGESSTHYHILGGNQGDEVNIRAFPKKGVNIEFVGARRCEWKIAQPSAVKPFQLAYSGTDASSVV